ncbi:hypothetical protein [Acetobacter sp. UBA5411]|uniref:hypothetical protein n=1 Tax=Acetobacter sp. UBA5411 TaxID=1945905 RepID=UPI0025B825A3|nr:hypothetical protein [Acetobacter sp. UBA5411]
MMTADVVQVVGMTVGSLGAIRGARLTVFGKTKQRKRLGMLFLLGGVGFGVVVAGVAQAVQQPGEKPPEGLATVREKYLSKQWWPLYGYIGEGRPEIRIKLPTGLTYDVGVSRDAYNALSIGQSVRLSWSLEPYSIAFMQGGRWVGHLTRPE